MKKKKEITLEQARKVLEVVDAGLCKGLGKPKPGQMCVEAAVCYALGQEHGDEPECVAKSVRQFKIKLNDSNWSSNGARAKGMRGIAIAQLGTKGEIDEKLFVKTLAELTIRTIVPIALRAAASIHKDKTHKAALELAAVECEKLGARESAIKAKTAAYAAAAAYAADADAYAAAYAAADAADAAYAAYAAADADDAADAYAAAYAAAAADDAADAYAAYAAADAKPSRRDEILSIAADIGIKALRVCGAAGVKLMDKLIS